MSIYIDAHSSTLNTAKPFTNKSYSAIAHEQCQCYNMQHSYGLSELSGVSQSSIGIKTPLQKFFNYIPTHPQYFPKFPLTTPSFTAYPGNLNYSYISHFMNKEKLFTPYPKFPIQNFFPISQLQGC